MALTEYRVSDLERDARFRFERGVRTTGRNNRDMDRPEDRDKPLDRIAHRMTLAKNTPLRIDIAAGHRDDLHVEVEDLRVRGNKLIEGQLHPALADKVSRIFVFLKFALQGATGQGLVGRASSDRAQHGVAGATVLEETFSLTVHWTMVPAGKNFCAAKTGRLSAVTATQVTDILKLFINVNSSAE
jgi:hypothetical protein